MKISWVTLLFITLTDRSLRLRQKLWRGLYNKIVSRDKLGQFLFMNYGYEDQHNKQSLYLEPEDEPFRYFIQLYHFVIQSLELQNKDVMEVGSGRGGGGSFIIRYKKPRSFIGIDLSEKAINWCKHYFQFKNTSWIQARQTLAANNEVIPARPPENPVNRINIASSSSFFQANNSSGDTLTPEQNNTKEQKTNSPK